MTGRIHFYTTNYSADEASQAYGGLREEDEETEILDLPLKQVLTMITDGTIRDAKTVILLHYAALHLMPED